MPPRSLLPGLSNCTTWNQHLNGGPAGIIVNTDWNNNSCCKVTEEPEALYSDSSKTDWQGRPSSLDSEIWPSSQGPQRAKLNKLPQWHTRTSPPPDAFMPTAVFAVAQKSSVTPRRLLWLQSRSLNPPDYVDSFETILKDFLHSFKTILKHILHSERIAAAVHNSMGHQRSTSYVGDLVGLLVEEEDTLNRLLYEDTLNRLLCIQPFQYSPSLCLWLAVRND